MCRTSSSSGRARLLLRSSQEDGGDGRWDSGSSGSRQAPSSTSIIAGGAAH